MLEREDIDCVFIAVPATVAFEICIDCINAHKHVFLEKPFAINVNNAKEIARTAQENNIIVHCDHIWIYNPYYQYLKEYCRNKTVNKVVIQKANIGPISKDINVALDLSVHDLAALDWLFEEEVQSVNNIATDDSNINFHHCQLQLQYKSYKAEILCSRLSQKKKREMVIYMSDRMVIFDDLTPHKIAIYKDNQVIYPVIQNQDSIRNSIDAFAKHIIYHTQSITNPNQGIRITKILELANQTIERKIVYV